MAAASSQHHSLHRSLANQARLAFAPIDAVLQLEETLLAVGVNVVGNRRSTQRNRLAQNLLHRKEKLVPPSKSNRGRSTPRPNPGAKQSLVRVDVAHAPQQFLIQQRALDRRLPPAEQSDKIFQLDIQRFEAPGVEVRLRNTQPPKAPRINKPQFPSRLQPDNGVGMLRHDFLR